ncbi:MAG TPA: hypothetical protein VGM73_12835 [Candidatus Didemnitutus sp.]
MSFRPASLTGELREFLRWAGLAALNAAPGAALGLFVYSHRVDRMLVIVGIATFVPPAFALAAIAAARLELPVMDSWLCDLRRALWLKLILNAAMAGLAADIFGGVCSLRFLEAARGLGPFGSSLRDDSLAVAVILSLAETMVVFGQVALLTLLLRAIGAAWRIWDAASRPARAAVDR